MKIARLHVSRRTLGAGRDGFLVVVGDEDGHVGLGEASPIPGYSPDDTRLVHGLLTRAGAELVDRTLEPETEAITALLAQVDLDFSVSPATRFALETALLDLAGRRRELPLHLLLGEDSRARALARSGLLARDDLLGSAEAAIARGLRTLKVKIDPAFLRDRFRDLIALRRVFDGALRVDANGSFAANEVEELFDRLAPLDPELVEEPTRGAALLELRDTLGAWAADESLADPLLADAILERGTCAAVVIKPALFGGLLRAREMAKRAEARGIGIIVTHAFDGPVALAAACELALSLEEPPLPCGLDPHALLEAWPACQLAQLDEPAWITASPEPGLGLDPAVFDGARW